MNASDHGTHKHMVWLIVTCAALIFIGGCGMYPLGMGLPAGSGAAQVSVNDLKFNEASPIFYSQAFIRQYAAFNERMRGFYRGVITPEIWSQNGCVNTTGMDPALRALKNAGARMENGSHSYSFSYRPELPASYFANFCAPH
ncbi:MAG: hypothetical protein ABFD81_04810 [Syntrophaceae bacterium]